MSQIYEKLLENSLSAALSSIEIYNKPNFKYREQIFTMLIVNAWELLLKAKIVKDANDNIESLYILDKNAGKYKLTKSGNPMTIEITRTMNLVNLDETIQRNLRPLIDYRDSVVHLYSDEALNYVLYTLGVAALQNYQKLIRIWFNQSLGEYNFYILPLGFTYHFQTLALIELEKEPEIISNLIKSVIDTKNAQDEDSDFFFTCEVTANVKKVAVTSDADLHVASNPDAKEKIVIERVKSLIEQYPFSYREVVERVKKELPDVKENTIQKIIREHKIKENSKMAAYNYRTKSAEDKAGKTGIIPSSTAVIYNDNAIRHIISTISSTFTSQQLQFAEASV